MPRAARLLLAMLAASAPTTLAHADLGDDTARVTRDWARRGASVERLASVFLEHGRVKVVGAGAKGKAASDLDVGCTAVLLLGTRSVDFVVGLGDPVAPQVGDDQGGTAAAEAPEGDGLNRSVAGSLMLQRCGQERAQLDRLWVRMGSTRGALEVAVARSLDPIGSVEAILPERVAGPTAPRGDPGRFIDPGPLAERIARSEQGARDDGATRVVSVGMAPSIIGTGELVLRMSEGCHRLTLLAGSPAQGPRGPVDIDAEARDAATNRVLARDRGEAADARLDLCLGQPQDVSVPFVGAVGAERVLALDAIWPIAEGVPTGWGHRARAGFAFALQRRKTPVPVSAPMFEAVGVQGTTEVPIAVEPGACYVAAVALVRGEARGVRVAAEIGDRAPQDQVGDTGDGAAVAFCTEASTSARLTIEVRGNGPWWALAVWRMGAGG